MAPFRTILFDLDGTLVDTEPGAARATVECFRKWSIAVDPQDARYVVGRTWESAFKFLFKKYPIPVPHAEAAKLLLETYRETLETDLRTVPGSVEAVKSLSGSYELGLVSGSGRSEILRILEKLQIREHFRVILGAEDYPRSKPAPDGYLLALQILQTTGPATLVFEDSEPGIASAVASGACVVAVTGTNYFQHDQSRAHHHVPDLTLVTPQWVESLPRHSALD